MPLRGQEKEKYKTRTDGPTGNDWTKKKLVYYTHTDTNVETDRHSEEDTLYIGWWRAGKKAFVLYFFLNSTHEKNCDGTIISLWVETKIQFGIFNNQGNFYMAYWRC